MEKPEAIKPEDHPDFVGGIVWTQMELRCIQHYVGRRTASLREELVAEAARTAEATLRANQAQDQHRMSRNMHAADYQKLQDYVGALTAAEARIAELQAEKTHPYKVGDLTAAEVFKAAGLQNMGDMQAVLNAVEKALESGVEWRRLALQFDGHRMQALAHLRSMLACPEDHSRFVQSFLEAAPLSGEAVLAERIATMFARHAAAELAAALQAAPPAAQDDAALQLAEACAGDWEAVRPHLVVQMLRDQHARISDLEALQAAAPAQAVTAPTDDELRAKWRNAGGGFHGPVVETGVMPEEKLLPFLRSLAAPAQEHATQLAGQGQHADDEAVDALAAEMKGKLADQRAKGYGGWNTEECTQQRLSDMLRAHVYKGDPVDVANFCAFLEARRESIAPAQAQEDARDALTLEELDKVEGAIAHFEDGEDTSVDWRLLTRAAYLGYLECERFTVPPTARAAIDAARAAQGGAA